MADDLLKNDGQKFLEMMEQLAERRMVREGNAVSSIEDDSEDEDEEEDEDEDEDDVEDGEGDDIEEDVRFLGARIAEWILKYLPIPARHDRGTEDA